MGVSPAETIPYVPVEADEVSAVMREYGRLYRLMYFETRIYAGPHPMPVFEVRLVLRKAHCGQVPDYVGPYYSWPTKDRPTPESVMYYAAWQALETMERYANLARITPLFEDK